MESLAGADLHKRVTQLAVLCHIHYDITALSATPFMNQ